MQTDPQPQRQPDPSGPSPKETQTGTKDILVVFYSRSGVTRTACEVLAEMLPADLEELADLKLRAGVLNWVKAGGDAAFGRLTELGPVNQDPSKYALVVIATPVWAFTMTPAVRTYLAVQRGKIAKVAFLATMGGSGDKRAFEHMAQVGGVHPVATLTLIDKDVRSNLFRSALKEFANTLRGR